MLVCVIFVFGSRTVTAATSGDYDYQLTHGGTQVEITGYHGSGGDLAIPSVIDGKPVTSLGNNSFYDIYMLTSVTIPDSVQSIGNTTFGNCLYLTSVTIPNSVTFMGENAFFYCTALTSVTIPGSIMTIESQTFWTCTALTSVVISPGVTHIADYAFIYCSALTSMVIPDSVTTIGNDSFNGCIAIASLTLPDGLAYIGHEAFGQCWALTSVSIPGSVTNIVDSFANSTTLTSVTISYGVKSLGTCAFGGCTALTSVTIPNSVTSIGLWAFTNCPSLTAISIPNSVTYMGDRVFEGCKSLAAVTIPGSVNSIGVMTFDTCLSLKSVTIDYGVKTILDGAFNECPNLTSVSIPNSVWEIGQGAFSFCGALTSISIPSSVTHIGGGVFNYCSSLTAIDVNSSNPAFASVEGILYDKSVTTLILCPQAKSGTLVLPDSVTTIDDSAFAGTSLVSITLSSNVYWLGTFHDTPYHNAVGVFPSTTLATILVNESNPTYTSVDGVLYDKSVSTLILCPEGKPGALDLPSSVTTIGDYATISCARLTSLTIDNNVTYIGWMSFRRCSNLTSVVIGSGVVGMDEYAFDGCTALTDVLFMGNAPSDGTGYPPTLDDHWFSGDSVNLTIHYISGATGFSSWGGLGVSIIALYAPSAPQDLQRTAGVAMVVLTWESPSSDGGSPITGYIVLYGTGSAETQFGDILSASTLTVNVTPLTPGTTYCFAVEAVNVAGVSPASDTVSAIPFTSPDAPVLTSAIGGVNIVALTWTAPGITGFSPLTGYKIYFGTSSPPGTLFAAVGNSSLAIDVTGLTAGVRYYFGVKATNIAGDSALSNILSAVPNVPGAPTLTAATPGIAKVTLNWTAPSWDGGTALVGYNVYYGTGVADTRYGGMLSPSTLGIVVSGLGNGIWYNFTVAAVNAVGEGVHSNVLSAATFSAPTAPMGLTAHAGNSEVSLNWTVPANPGNGALVYHLFRDGVEVWSGIELQHVDAPITNDATYSYEVAATNDVGWGSNSSAASATPFGIPTAPVYLHCNPGNGQISINWSAPSYIGQGALTYHLSRNGTLVWSGTITNWIDTGLVNGHLYSYQVAASNVMGWGPNCTAVQAAPIAPVPPGVPSNFHLISGDGSVSLSWEAPTSSGSSAVTSYKVYWGTNATSMTLLTTVSSGTSYVHSGLSNGQVYYYKVCACSLAGESAVTSVLSATPQASGGTNPTSDNTTLIVAIGVVVVIGLAGVVAVMVHRKK
ncbi:MAG: leucine-rich repeat protein [Methanomassiliicoccales archaeon]